MARMAVLGMSAAAEVKLTPAEAFALLARASKLLSLSGARDWMSDTASQVAFLSMSAYHEWVCGPHLTHDELVLEHEEQGSPESAVSVHQWERALKKVSGIPGAKVRIAQVRIINSMGRAF